MSGAPIPDHPLPILILSHKINETLMIDGVLIGYHAQMAGWMLI